MINQKRLKSAKHLQINLTSERGPKPAFTINLSEDLRSIS